MSDWNHKYYERHKPKLRTSMITLSTVIFVIFSLTICEQFAFYRTFPHSTDTIDIGESCFSLNTYARRRSSLYGQMLSISLEIVANRSISDIELDFNATRTWLIPGGGFWSWRFYYETSLVYVNQSKNSVKYILNYTDAKNSENYKYLGNGRTFDAIVAIHHTFDAQWVFLHQKGIETYCF